MISSEDITSPISDTLINKKRLRHLSRKISTQTNQKSSSNFLIQEEFNSGTTRERSNNSPLEQSLKQLKDNLIDDNAN